MNICFTSWLTKPLIFTYELIFPRVFIPNVSQCLWERPNPSPGCPKALRDFEGMPLTWRAPGTREPQSAFTFALQRKAENEGILDYNSPILVPRTERFVRSKCLRPVDLLFSHTFSPTWLLWPWLESWRHAHSPGADILCSTTIAGKCKEGQDCKFFFPSVLSHFLITFSLISSPFSLPSFLHSISYKSPTFHHVGWVSSLSSLFGFPALVLASFDLGGRSGIYWLVQHLGGLWWLLFLQYSPLWQAQVLLTHLQMGKSRFVQSSDQPKGQRTSMLKRYHFRLGQSSLTFHLQRSWAPPFSLSPKR